LTSRNFWLGFLIAFQIVECDPCRGFPRGIHTVKIRSKAHISLDPSLEITQRIEDDLDYVRLHPLFHFNMNDCFNDLNFCFTPKAETMAYPDRLDTGESPSVPLWIIIVSVLAGILLLVLLILFALETGILQAQAARPHSEGQSTPERQGAQR
jgi:hypothetical protein